MKSKFPLKNENTGKNIYLHIGVPKTASTTIQQGLYKNEIELEKINYLFPKAGREKNNHKNIFFEICSFPSHQVKFNPEIGTLKDLAKEIRNSELPNVIISAEHFALLTEGEIALMHKALGQFSTKVIVYVRRQDQVIQSGWIQNTKRYVINKSLDQNIDDEISNEQTIYHYDNLLANWAKYFGVENINVRVFERSQLSGHIFTDFLNACNIEDTSAFTLPASGNISPSENTMGLVIEISKKLDFSNLPPSVLYNIGKQIEIACNDLGWQEGRKFNQIDEDLYNKIMSHYEAGNRQVAEKYLGKSQLFEEGYSSSHFSQFSLEDIPQEEIVKIFASVLNNINKLISDPMMN